MSPDRAIPARLAELLQQEDWPVGSHLPAQKLADRLRVSRSPINDALDLLRRKGVVRREARRGYFVERRLQPQDLAALDLADGGGAEALYARIADDRLRGALPDEVTESLLKNTYGVTQGRLDAVLARIAGEGWAEKKPGYGWAFSAMLATPDSLLQSYRMRLALEPAALREPGYRLSAPTVERLRAVERHLLAGGIESDSALQLHDRGVSFHEALVEASGNPFFIDTLKRVNRVRRLLSYRSMQDRSRHAEHARQHLRLLDLLAAGRQADAAAAMRAHLQATLRNIGRIGGLLRS